MIVINREEMLNMENPLLLKFKEVAPGSFHHCERVASLLKKVGIYFKLDFELLETIGLYHDIGKMRYPVYYCENQPKNENIHDKLDPTISAQLIMSHIANSIAILSTSVKNIEPEIIKYISMHHGDQVLKSIMNKIPKEEQTNDLIKMFTYPYAKPDDIYASTLMICDTCEAAIAGMTAAGIVNSENMNEKIYGLIDGLVINEQLDSLTIGQKRTITNIIVEEFLSGNHKRVTTEYEEK